MGKEIPGWFLVTTTVGIVMILFMLWLNYTAITALNRADYALLQSDSDVSALNSGMMRVVASSMMKNGLMNLSDFEVIDQAYNSSVRINSYMGQMMNGWQVNDANLNQTLWDHTNARNMMYNMMR